MASIPQVPELEDENLAYYLEQINLYLASTVPAANTVVVEQSSNTFAGGYPARYLSVAYANSTTGVDFGNLPANRQFFATFNSNDSVWSNNAADYVYFEVNQGFGASGNLFYQVLGGRQISFVVGSSNAAPNNFSVVPTGVSIDLDTPPLIVSPGVSGGSTIIEPGIITPGVIFVDQGSGQLATIGAGDVNSSGNIEADGFITADQYIQATGDVISAGNLYGSDANISGDLRYTKTGTPADTGNVVGYVRIVLSGSNVYIPYYQ